MATLNLGRIKPVFRGAYSGSTAYVVDDIVTHGNESFICIQAHGAGTQATSVTAYWTKLAAKGTDGTDVGTTITTQGDILYRDGSGLQRLAKPASNKILQNTSGGVLSWEDAAGGLFSNFQQYNFTTEFSHTGSTDNSPEPYTDVTGFLDVITPTSASNDVLIMCKIAGVSTNDGFFSIQRKISGGADTELAHDLIAASGGRTRTLTADVTNISHASKMSDLTIILKDSPATTSAVTYQVRCAIWGSATIYVNRAVSNNDAGWVGEGMSNITLMEMA